MQKRSDEFEEREKDRGSEGEGNKEGKHIKESRQEKTEQEGKGREEVARNSQRNDKEGKEPERRNEGRLKKGRRSIKEKGGKGIACKVVHWPGF